MRLNKYLPLSLFSLALVPVIGLFFSILSISKNKMNRIPFLFISLFYFFFLIKLPPYGDSFRRYINYLSYTPGEDISAFIHGHPDVFFYFSIIIFRQLNIPYFIMPALYGAMMIYFVLSSLRNCLIICNCEPVGFRKIFIFLVMLSAFDIINYSLGLRFGLAIATVSYAITTYCRGAKVKGSISLFLSITIHFSMIYIVACFILSRFVYINKRFVIPLSIISFSLSSMILPLILSNISFMGIGSYAMSGYVESGWANASDNLNTWGVSFVRNILQLGVFILFMKSKEKFSVIDNFICFLIPAVFLTSLSFSAVQRFLVVCNIILLARVLPVYYDFLLKKIHVFVFFVFFMVTSGIVLNIYVQRVAFIWGNLWMGYFSSPITLLDYSSAQFNHYLSEVSSDGNWVKNRQGE